MRTRASVVVVHEKKLLIVKMQDPKTKTIYLFPPGGMVEANETPEAAAARETLEETGYTVFVDGKSVVQIRYDFLWAGVNFPCLTFVYRATLTPEPRQPFEQSEIHLGVDWIPLETLPEVLSYHTVIRDAVLSLVS